MEKTKLRVAIYYRTNYPDNMKPFINSMNNLPDNTLVFIDYASGVENRPALNKLLNLVQNKKIDVIITDSLNRFSRKNEELEFILHEIQKYNVKIVLDKAKKYVSGK